MFQQSRGSAVPLMRSDYLGRDVRRGFQGLDRTRGDADVAPPGGMAGEDQNLVALRGIEQHTLHLVVALRFTPVAT
jgi:hypothetical protein